MPLSKLEAVPGEINARKSNVYAPATKLTLEGAYTRLIYLAPEGRSSLEIFRNYEDEITAKNGEILFTCKSRGCGGDPLRSVGGAVMLAAPLVINAISWPRSVLMGQRCRS